MHITVIIGMLLSSGIPQEDINTMICIAYRESKFNHKAINHYNRNGTKDYGLFQINSVWFKECKMSGSSLLVPENNIKCAAHVYNTQGIEAWATYPRCKGKE